MPDRTVLGAGAVYSGVFPLLMYAVYATGCIRGGGGDGFAVPVLCLACVVLYLANALILHRGAALPVLVVCNVILWGGGIAAMVLLSRFTGLGRGFMIVFLTLVAFVIAVYSAFSPVTLTRMLTFCDVTALGTGWMCLLEAGGGIPASHLLYCIAALLLVMGTLLVLRTFGESRDVVYGSRLWGALLSVGLLALIGVLLYLFFRYLSGASRQAVSALLTGAAAALAAVGSALSRFFHWLFSLFPVGEIEEPPPEMEPTQQMPAEEELLQMELDLRPFLVIGIILAAVAVTIAVIVIWRRRKTRLTVSGAEKPVRQHAARSGRGAPEGWLARLWFQIRFRVVFFFQRSSPTGLLVWLERWGKRHDMPRGSGETPRAYLNRLAALPQALEDSELPGLLNELADALDRQYFGEMPSVRLPGRGPARLRRGVSRLKLTAEKD